MTTENHAQPLIPQNASTASPSPASKNPRLKLWDWFVTNHDLHLLDSQLNDIIHAVGDVIKAEAAPASILIEEEKWDLFWEMFHKLWGQNSAGEYSKATWKDFQAHVLALRKLKTGQEEKEREQTLGEPGGA